MLRPEHGCRAAADDPGAASNVRATCEVLDELEARKVPLDMDTWMVLEETFTVGMRRDNPKRGDVT